MKCTIEAWKWKKILQAAYMMKGEVVFNFEKEGLRIRTFDDTHTMVMEMRMPASVWKEYEPIGEPIKLSVTEMLKRITGKLEPTHLIDLICDLKTSSQFKSDLMSIYGHRIFGVPVLHVLEELDKEPAPVRKFVADVKAKVVASALEQAVIDAGHVTGLAGKRAKAKEKVGGYFFMEGRREPDRFVVWVTEPGTFNSSWNEFEEPLSLLELEVGSAKVKSCYGVVQVRDICRAGMPFSDVCLIQFAENLPAKITFQLPFEGVLEFFVAPRIEGR